MAEFIQQGFSVNFEACYLQLRVEKINESDISTTLNVICYLQYFAKKFGREFWYVKLFTKNGVLKWE